MNYIEDHIKVGDLVKVEIDLSDVLYGMVIKTYDDGTFYMIVYQKGCYNNEIHLNSWGKYGIKNQGFYYDGKRYSDMRCFVVGHSAYSEKSLLVNKEIYTTYDNVVDEDYCPIDDHPSVTTFDCKMSESKFYIYDNPVMVFVKYETSGTETYGFVIKDNDNTRVAVRLAAMIATTRYKLEVLSEYGLTI